MEEFVLDYKLLSLERNPHYERLKQINKEVKKFIKDKQLIITGGMAIDIALRMKGEHIYNLNSADTALPDWDFYSPNHVIDAYELTNLLYELDYGNDGTDKNGLKIDCIRALHMTTLSVRFFYESVADITYVPMEIYKKLPYLIADGIKIIHPHWQMMNQHHAIAFPLVNPPREVIFHRLDKDISRHEKLFGSYPFPSVTASFDLYKIKWNFNFVEEKDYTPLLTGFSAYAAIYTLYKIYKLDLTDIYPLDINEDYFTSPINISEFIVGDIPNISIIEGLFEPFLDYSLPIYKIKNSNILLHYINKNVIPVSIFTLGKSKNSYTVFIPESNVILLHFLLYYHISDNKLIFAKFYTSLLYMVQRMSSYVNSLIESDDNKDNKKAEDIIFNSPFFIQKRVFGKENESETFHYNQLVIIKDLQRYANIEQIELPTIPPMNYKPSPQFTQVLNFDYNKSPYFYVNGTYKLLNSSSKNNEIINNGINNIKLSNKKSKEKTEKE